MGLLRLTHPTNAYMIKEMGIGIYDLGFKVFLICVIGEICGYPFM